MRSSRIKSLISRGHYIFLTAVLALTATLANIPISHPAHAAIGTITEYTLPVSGSILQDITVGPDNNIWYTGYGPTINTRIGELTTAGSFTEYPNRPTGSRYPHAITKGSDGNIWYSEYTNSGINQIIKMTTTGTVLGQYPLSTGYTPLSMTLGPDGAVWFAGEGGIGKITTSGLITNYLTLAASEITVGPDGNLWYTITGSGSSSNFIGKITTSGIFTNYPVGTLYVVPHSITTGPDGNLWFTTSNQIGKITTSGVITEYSVGPNIAPYSIATGSDGSLWFTESNSGKIGRITTSGVITAEYVVPGAASNILGKIIAGPDGAVWFSTGTLGKIGRVATELTNQTISFASTAPIDAAIDGATYTPTASATSGLPVAITVDSSSSSVCSIDGTGVVSFQGAGTCVLNANQAGDVDYNPASQVQQSFMVLPVDADSSVSLSCPTTAHVGDTVTCTITIANNGPAASRDATLAALFPSSLSGASLSGGGVLSGQNITWTTPSLASGDSTTLTFSATASAAGQARFSAALLQTSPDPNNSNNLVDATITVL